MARPDPAAARVTAYLAVPTTHGVHWIPEGEPEHTECPFCACDPERRPGEMLWRHRPASEREPVGRN